MNRPQNYGAISRAPEVEFLDANSSEFNGLCDNVVTNIYTINSSWKTLENGLKSIGTIKDNPGVRDKLHVTQLSANQIAAVTSKDLGRLKILVRRAKKQKQLQVEKLEENFKEALEKYSSLQKQVAEKMKAHLLTIVDIEHEERERDDTAQQQAQMTRELAFEQDMLLEREARIRQIEADVLDVNQIMRELGSLVNQQGEVIDTIENTIDYATGNVEEGTSQLLKASQYQNKYRRKLLVLILIATVIVVILAAVLVTELRK